MNRHLIAPALAAVIVTMAPAAASADHLTSLSQVAAKLGYAYSYLGPEDAVALTKPGVTIVIRPGERLFDVNDRTEAMDGSAPVFSRSDIFVSDALVARLRAISFRFPSQTSGDRAIVVQNGPSVANASGSISNLTLAQEPGKQDIAVSGKAPANLPITLTLVGSFSQEIPDTVVSRNEVLTDADGTFKTSISPAPAYYRGAILTVVASSVAGVTSAKAHIVLKAPNGTTNIPGDVEPRGVR